MLLREMLYQNRYTVTKSYIVLLFASDLQEDSLPGCSGPAPSAMAIDWQEDSLPECSGPDSSAMATESQEPTTSQFSENIEPLNTEPTHPSPQDCAGGWKHGLPNMSPVLNPLLMGEPMNEKKKKKLSGILRDDLIRYLDSKNIVAEGTTANRRWSYHSLGVALRFAYPDMMLEDSRKKPLGQAADGVGLFISRLANTRKMRRLRQVAKLAKKTSQQQIPKQTVSYLDAVAELKALEVMGITVDYDFSRMSLLLEITLPNRQLNSPESLPLYFLDEDVVSKIMWHINFRAKHGKLRNLDAEQKNLSLGNLRIAADVLLGGLAFEENIKLVHSPADGSLP